MSPDLAPAARAEPEAEAGRSQGPSRAEPGSPVREEAAVLLPRSHGGVRCSNESEEPG